MTLFYFVCSGLRRGQGEDIFLGKVGLCWRRDLTVAITELSCFVGLRVVCPGRSDSSEAERSSN